VKYRDFVRAGIVMSVYDEARENNQKHSVAVVQAVEFVRQRYPKMRISGTGVRRILALWRPRNSGTVLRFERSTVTDEEAGKIAAIRQRLTFLQQTDNPVLPALSDVYPSRTATVFRFGFSERPNYPRHNRKPSEDGPQ
jgi:hypothetical protein